MSNRGGTFIKLNETADQEAVSKYGEKALVDMVPVECPPYKGHSKCITEWIKLIAGEEADIRTTGRDCRGTVEVAEAAYLAVDERRVVSLPIEPRQWVESGSGLSTGKTSDASYHIEA